MRKTTIIIPKIKTKLYRFNIMKYILTEEQSNFLLHDMLDQMFKGHTEVYATPEEKLIYVGDKLLMIRMPTKAILSKDILNQVQNVLFYDTMKDFKDSVKSWVLSNFPAKSGIAGNYGISFKDFDEKIKVIKRRKPKETKFR